MKLPLIALTVAALALPSCGKNDAGTTANAGSKPTEVEIKNFGSDTMLEVAGAWSEAYAEVKPHVVVSVSGGGSGTGIAGIINGTVDIANCSREMHKNEIETAEKQNRHPVVHQVGFDGIAIYVHKQNPIAKITFAQLKDIFGKDGKVTKWSQLGITMPAGVSDDIVVVSRQNNSGTFEYFREDVLGNSNFRGGTLDQSGSKQVVELVSKTPGAIGYSGLAYASPQVRMVPVAKTDADQPVSPSIDTVLDHSYPISRPLFMYTNGEPVGAIKDYLDWITSDDGQRVLQKNGYPPLRRL